MVRLLTITLLCTLVAGPALADPQSDADALVREADTHFVAGEFHRAIQKLKGAQRLYPRAEQDCNVGLAYTRLERWHQAHLFLDRCRRFATSALPEWVDPRFSDVLSHLESEDYGLLALAVDPTGADVRASAYAPDESALAPAELWVPAGEHRVHASKEGYRPESRVVTVERGAKVVLSLALVAEVVAAPPEPVALPPEPVVEVEAAPAVEAERPIWPWIVLGTGVASLGAAVGLHVLAVDTRSEAEGLPPGLGGGAHPDFSGLESDFELERGLAIGFYAAAAVATGVAIYGLLDEPDPSTPRAGVSPLPAGGMVVLEWGLPN